MGKPAKAIKPKPCNSCKQIFTPWISTTQVTCSLKCAIAEADKQKEKLQERKRKAQRAETRKRREALKSKSELAREAQNACNEYIRLRDKDEPCISCGTTNPDIQYCAGHYKTRGAYPELRFHPMNLHKQCNHHCNLQKSGNIPEYRKSLIKKIGQSNVDWLEGFHKVQNYTADDYREIKAYFKEQTKLLRANNGNN